MCVKLKASVQNHTKKTGSDVDPNFLSTNEETRFPNTVVEQNGKGTYLNFVSVQI